MSESNETVRRGHFNKKILLKTGVLNKLYLWGNPTHIVPATVFAFDSAFPSPGIAIHLKTIQEIIEENENMRLVVFGHADYKGSLEYNKKLSERRARGVLASMTGDLEMFLELIEDPTFIDNVRIFVENLDIVPNQLYDLGFRKSHIARIVNESEVFVHRRLLETDRPTD